MIGHESGAVTRIQAVNPKIVATHCVLHRQALASKSMAPDLHDVLEAVSRFSIAWYGSTQLALLF